MWKGNLVASIYRLSHFERSIDEFDQNPNSRSCSTWNDFECHAWKGQLTTAYIEHGDEGEKFVAFRRSKQKRAIR